MREVVNELMNDRSLAARHRDHELSSEYAGVRECHVAPDWLLIYSKEGPLEEGALKLIRTGSHSGLFWCRGAGADPLRIAPVIAPVALAQGRSWGVIRQTRR